MTVTGQPGDAVDPAATLGRELDAAPATPSRTEAALPDGTDATLADDGRPTKPLPVTHLLRISAYWLGLTAVMAGLAEIVSGRLQYAGLAQKGFEGTVMLQIGAVGTVIAILVQPTIGSISDYTISRWGRRKPYIVIGSLLDLVFLLGVGTSNALPVLAAFVAMLQFSSNFAQGPFQGYVPDLVPEKQVGLASGLMGLFSTLGNVLGYLVGAIAIIAAGSFSGAYLVGLMVLGVIEVVTMLSVVIRVDEGRRAKPRDGKSWVTIGREVWATDILHEHGFVWLVASRFFILLAGSLLGNFGVFYLAQTFGMNEEDAGTTVIFILAVVAIATSIAVIPASRLSDRIGRKPVIYAACVLGAIGLAIVATSPSILVAYPGVALIGISGGSFLAVDWALMTDIVPKASAGRYMGISNVATASCGLIGIAIGGAIVMDVTNRWLGYGVGPRATFVMGIASFAIGALLLHPVVEPRRRRRDAPRPTPTSQAAVAP